VPTLEYILSLPLNSKIFCGDDTSIDNIYFHLSLDPTNKQLKEILGYFKALKESDQLIAGTLLALETQYNP